MLSKINDIDTSIAALQQACDERIGLSHDDKSVAFWNLYQCAISEAERIKNDSKEIFSIAVSLRNLFEIYMLALHLRDSEEAVQQWYGQLLRDVLDIQDGLIALFSKHGIHSPDLDSTREKTIESGERNNVKPIRPFNIKEIAKRFDREEDYNAMYKLCSKLVHPSSVKVNLPAAFDKNDEYIKSLIHVAVHYMSLIAEVSANESA